MDAFSAVRLAVTAHYERYVYPQFPLLSSVKKADTYALNLESLWARFNGEKPGAEDQQILLAGCGSFSPYPTAVANPNAKITALDLSRANLRRARFHTLLHGYFNVNFIADDLLQAPAFLKHHSFHFIDCYGVLHHIPDISTALQTIHRLLKPGAMARMMVYSHGARRRVQSAARAMRLAGINDVKKIRAAYHKTTQTSRFRQCIDADYESEFDWGLADMFLHPYARIYRLDELLALFDEAHLEPLLFTHYGALPDTEAEIARLKTLETRRLLSTHFVLLAGRTEDAEMRRRWQEAKIAGDTLISLNPVIKNALPFLPFISLKPSSKLGFDNPLIDTKANFLLSRFKHPVKKSTISPAEWQALQKYLQALFLIETRV